VPLQEKSAAQLSLITAPTLIMVGAKNAVATPAIAAEMQTQTAWSRLVPFETGHFMMAEGPNDFQRVMGRLLHALKKYASCHRCSPERGPFTIAQDATSALRMNHGLSHRSLPLSSLFYL
jgi:hypothetical protein